MGSSEVTADICLSFLVPGREPVDLVATLRYQAGDPYAITAAFHVGAGDPVAWAFARELVADGMERPAGAGDVRIRPDTGGRLRIRLLSDDGEAAFRARAGDLRDFLEETYRLVPAGEEGSHVDVGEELAAWLGQL